MTVTETEAPELSPDEFDRPVPWYGVLAPEGVTTGDKRRFALGSLRHRDLPISLAWQPSDFGGHDGAVTVANIQKIWRHGNLLMGSGEFSTTEADATRVVDLIAEGMLKGISVDLDDVTLAADETDAEMTEVMDGRISSATIVRIPAFAEAFITLGTWEEAEADAEALEQEAVTAGCLPCELLAQNDLTAAVSDKPWSDFSQSDYSDDQWYNATAMHTNGDSRAKSDNKLPYKEPSGAVNRNGVHAAASRFNQTDGPAEAKAAAKAKLRGAYKQLGEEVPDALAASAEEMTFATSVQVGDHVQWDTPHEEEGDGIHDGEVEHHVGVVEAIDGDTATVIEDSNDDDGGDSYQVAVADLTVIDSSEDDSDRPAFLDDEAATAEAEQFAPGTRDGPGWLTNPVDSQRLRNYWAKGEGAAKIRWGVPGDFNRCRKQLAKYVPNPQWLAGTCANLHKVAIGVWPGQEASLVAAAPAFSLVAAATPVAAPKEWFENPQLDGATPITVTEDGRIYGHAAQWGTCHIGFQGLCQEAPPSSSDYSRFMLGSYLTAEGETLRVGTITMGTGHAEAHATASAAIAHYDNTGTASAYVCAGADDYGIWIAGTVDPGLSDTDKVKLRAAKLSGDWRQYGSELDLVALLAVNVPGFPVPRTALAASGDRQLSLVAAGIVADPEPPVTEDVAQQFSPSDLAKMVAREMAKLQTRRTATEEARQVFAAERAARAEQARQILEGAH